MYKFFKLLQKFTINPFSIHQFLEIMYRFKGGISRSTRPLAEKLKVV
jgi:hypothetical protein